MPDIAEAWPLVIVERLLAASIRGGVVVALVWLVCRHLPRLAPSTRAALWWTASLALVVALVPLPAVSIPVLPAAPAANVAHSTSATAALREAGANVAVSTFEWTNGSAAVAAGGSRDTGVSTGTTRISWRHVLVALWFCGVAFGLLHVLMAGHRIRTVLARSSPADDTMSDLAARMADALGVTPVPPVRTSDEILSPQVTGLWRPTVLLPSSAAGWRACDRRMSLCHELAHVQRRDLLFGWIPLLAERLLFFHPLAHLAAREYVIAREAACDAVVLRTLDVEPQQYGRLLVRIGVVRRQLAAAGGAASSVRALRRRLEMLNEYQSERKTNAWMWVLALALGLAVLPVRFVSAVEPTAAQDAIASAPVRPAVTPQMSFGPPVVPADVQPAAAPQPLRAAQEPAQRQPEPRPDTPARAEPAPVQPDTQRQPAAETPATAQDSFEEWVERTQQALREMAQATLRMQEAQAMAERQALIYRELDATRQRLQALDRALTEGGPGGWGGWWSDFGHAGEQRQRLEQQMQSIEKQRAAMAQAQEDLARSSETLARQLEELARRQKELLELQRVLERIESTGGGSPQE